MFQVLAIDLDDTLLDSNGIIGQATVTMLEAWRASGRHIVVATGRPPRSVVGALPPVLDDVHWICYNGAEVRYRNRTIFTDSMEPDVARCLVEWALVALDGWRIGIERDDVLYLNRRLDIDKQYVHVENIADVCRGPIAKVLFSNGALNRSAVSEPTDYFADLDPLLAGLPPGVRPMLSRRYRLAQFMSATADKAVALGYVVNSLGCRLDQVVAFGDDVNDVDMLRAAGLGIAMANAVEEVHRVADRVTATNDEEGIALVLAELLGHD